MIRLKSFILVVLLAFLCLLFLLFSPILSKGVANGISICLQTLIPSMFAFMALADFIGRSGFISSFASPFSWVFRKLFKLDAGLSGIFLLSAIGGFPIGALLIKSKLEEHEISAETANFMLRFCIFPSPAFLIGAVSQRLWSTPSVGVIIYCSQLISALLIVVIGRFFHGPYSCQKQNDSGNSENLSSVFVTSIKHSISSMSLICGFVILFCGGFSLLDLLNLPTHLSLLIKGLLEVTSGCQLISGLSFLQSTLFVAAITSFGGACVHLQIIAILRGFKIKLACFFLWRIIFTAMSVTLTYFGIRLLNLNAPCFTSTPLYTYKPCSISPISSVFLLGLGFMFLWLSFRQNCGKIKNSTTK